MKRHRLLNLLFIWSICSLTALPVRADQDWSRVAPQGAGFSVDAPVAAAPTDIRNFYLYPHRGWSMSVAVFTHDEASRQRLAADRRAPKRELETIKKEVLEGWGAVRDGNASSGEVDGQPSIRFAFDDGQRDGLGLIVMTGDRLYEIVAIGPRGSSDEDAKRFIRSFRLATQAAEPR